jgi:uncharacterized membrane protein YedE/YeeE
MQTPTILPALAGGALIGASASLLLLTHGRVAGISGLVGGLLQRKTDDRGDRALFVAGLLLAGALAMAFAPKSFGASPMGLGVVALAGLLVGFGTRLGNGCTSGHGVCGISRVSGRSLVATLTFMATGAVATLVAKKFLGGAA